MHGWDPKVGYAITGDANKKVNWEALIAHVLRDLHRAEFRPAYGAEMLHLRRPCAVSRCRARPAIGDCSLSANSLLSTTSGKSQLSRMALGDSGGRAGSFHRITGGL